MRTWLIWVVPSKWLLPMGRRISQSNFILVWYCNNTFILLIHLVFCIQSESVDDKSPQEPTAAACAAEGGCAALTSNVNLINPDNLHKSRPSRPSRTLPPTLLVWLPERLRAVLMLVVVRHLL